MIYKLAIGNRQTSLLRLDRVFVILALVFGNALIFINPPFQTADEAQHFFRAWQITSGEFICRGKDSLGEAGGMLPASLETFWKKFQSMAMHPEETTSVREILDSFKIHADAQELTFVPFGNTAHYCPISYVPQCIGVALGRAFSLPLPMILYLGREGNLLVFALLGGFSLRWAPTLSRPMFLLLLMPTMLALAASVSADALTDGLAILWVAMICRYFAADRGSICRGTIALLLLVSIPLSVGKLVYFPLLALLFLIPRQNFCAPARKAMMIVLLAVLNLAALIGWAAATSNLETKITVEKNISPQGQLARLEDHPLHFANLLWNTAAHGTWFVCTTFVGVIGWMDLNFPPAVVIAYLLSLIFFCWTAGDRPPLPSPKKAAMIVLPALVVSVLAIAFLNLLYWTPIDSNYILGLQGRYLIPLTPAVFLLICSVACRWIAPRSDMRLNAAAILVSITMCGCLLILVTRRFYI